MILPPEKVAAFSTHSFRVGSAQELLGAGGRVLADVLVRNLEYAEHNMWETHGT